MERLQKYRVLLVEDSPTWQEYVFAVVDNRYDIVTVPTLYEAIEQLTTRQDWDCIILDLRLPDSPERGEDVFATFRKILASGHSTGVPIFITPGDQMPDESGTLFRIVSKDNLGSPQRFRDEIEAVIQSRGTNG